MSFHIFTCFRNVRNTVFPVKVPTRKNPAKLDMIELISKLLGLLKLNKNVVLPTSFSVLVTTFFFLSTQILKLKLLK